MTSPGFPEFAAGLEASALEIVSADLRGTVSAELPPDDLRLTVGPAWAVTHEAAIEIHRRGEPVSATTIAAELRATGMIDVLRGVGRLDFLVALVEHRPIFTTVGFHVEQIKTAARWARAEQHVLALLQTIRSRTVDTVDIDVSLRVLGELRETLVRR